MKNKAQHPLFRRWTTIREALLNERSPNWHYGGALGLDCTGLDDFEVFAYMVERTIGLPPFPGARLNRINQYKGWVKGNLRWATNKEITRGQRHTYKVKVGGKTKNLKEWCEELQFPYYKARRRIIRGLKGQAIFA